MQPADLSRISQEVQWPGQRHKSLSQLSVFPVQTKLAHKHAALARSQMASASKVAQSRKQRWEESQNRMKHGTSEQLTLSKLTEKGATKENRAQPLFPSSHAVHKPLAQQGKGSSRLILPTDPHSPPSSAWSLARGSANSRYKVRAKWQLPISPALIAS